MSKKQDGASPQLPWKLRLYFPFLSLAMRAARRPNGAVNRRLTNLLDVKYSPSQKPINGVKTSDIIVDTTRNLWFRLYIPTTTKDDDVNLSSMPVIVYFHGGGFVLTSVDSKLCEEACRRLAKDLNAVIASVNYRLAPEHRCPCQYEDGFDALKFMDEHFENNFPSNADPNRCFLAGESAGANLAHHVAVKAGEYKKMKIIGLISIQPFLGGEERTESETRLSRGPVLSLDDTDWFWKAFLPDGSDRDHPAVNVFGANAVDIISGVKFPDTLLFVGGFDLIQDWQRRYYEGLKKCGKQVYLIEYPNAVHGFVTMFQEPEYSLFIEDVKDFMQKQSLDG